MQTAAILLATFSLFPLALSAQQERPADTSGAKVTLSAARAVALAQVPGGKVVDNELEREHGRLVYSFDIKDDHQAGLEEVHVDAQNGQVAGIQHVPEVTEGAGVELIEEQPGLLADAQTPYALAKDSALAQVPDGTLQTAVLEHDPSGHLVYHFEIRTPSSATYDVLIDAKTGEVMTATPSR